MGGILQGIGFALSEERVVDPTTGTVVNAGFEDYKVPTIADLPEVVCEFVGRPDPNLALGIKGLGEPPIIPTAGRDRKRARPCAGRAAARGAATPRGGCWRRWREDVRLHAPGHGRRGRRGARSPATRGRWAAAPTCSRSTTAASARPASVVDLRGLGHGRDRGRRRRPADRRDRHRVRRSRPTRASPSDTRRCPRAARAAASPQLREMGTVGGNLCQQVRCWYFRHPDLTCWLRGGDTCYAQIGDHRKHGLEQGDCISVAPSDLAAALLALDARVTTNRREAFPLAELYRRPTDDRRVTVDARAGRVPDRRHAAGAARRQRLRAGRRARTPGASRWRASPPPGSDGRSGWPRSASATLPRLLDPADPLAGLPGLEQIALEAAAAREPGRGRRRRALRCRCASSR